METRPVHNSTVAINVTHGNAQLSTHHLSAAVFLAMGPGGGGRHVKKGGALDSAPSPEYGGDSLSSGLGLCPVKMVLGVQGSAGCPGSRGVSVLQS